LKIALIGYGKMGKEIERLALARGDTIVSVSDVDSLPTTEDLAPAEVAIDFSVPDAVIHNLKLAADTGVDMVVGTTGWYDHLGEVRKWFDSSALIYAENFSIGVNLFYRVVREAARLMGGFGDYDAFVAEEHHNQKLDSPSGTALRLGAILVDALPGKERLATHSGPGGIRRDELQISSVRAGSIAGVHRVGFDSPADTIELRHTARNRTGFALGALAAAHWVRGRRGVFTMDDVEL
jgi:4-hydroxy-tetrahydrodipicolinate reductase